RWWTLVNVRRPLDGLILIGRRVTQLTRFATRTVSVASEPRGRSCRVLRHRLRRAKHRKSLPAAEQHKRRDCSASWPASVDGSYFRRARIEGPCSRDHWPCSWSNTVGGFMWRGSNLGR